MSLPKYTPSQLPSTQAAHSAMPGDQTAHIAVVLMGALLRKSTDDYFAHGNTVPFEKLIRANFAAAQSLFEPPRSSTT